MSVGVGAGVLVGVNVGVFVFVGVGVDVGASVAVGAAVATGVGIVVGVGLGVFVGVALGKLATAVAGVTSGGSSRLSTCKPSSVATRTLLRSRASACTDVFFSRGPNVAQE